MRSNQKRLAQSLANPGRTDTRDVKRALAVVPFRHSKLTEVLMDYFVGDGRVVSLRLRELQAAHGELVIIGDDRQHQSLRYRLRRELSCDEILCACERSFDDREQRTCAPRTAQFKQAEYSRLSSAQEGDNIKPSP